MSSTVPISTARWPSNGSRPVVSVSMTISRSVEVFVKGDQGLLSGEGPHTQCQLRSFSGVLRLEPLGPGLSPVYPARP
jgi:hypothetical protein